MWQSHGEYQGAPKGNWPGCLSPIAGLRSLDCMLLTQEYRDNWVGGVMEGYFRTVKILAYLVWVE